jgi:hypothetical protein
MGAHRATVMDHASGRFFSVAQDVGDEVEHVLIRHGVEDVLAVAPTREQPFPSQDLQSLGDSGHGVAGIGGDVRDASLSGAEQLEEPQAGGIPRRTQHPSRAPEDGLGGSRSAGRTRTLMRFVDGAARRLEFGQINN